MDHIDTQDYLNTNPEIEMSLFIDWCETCFTWAKTEGTTEEWLKIRKDWYPGKAPKDAVSQILSERMKAGEIL